MGFLSNLIKNKKCSICKIKKNNRFCIRNGREICWSCCNEIRIKGDCPEECKFYLEKTEEQIFSQKTNVESRSEYDHLIKLLFDKWTRLPQDAFGKQIPNDLSKTKKGKKELEEFFLKIPSNPLIPLNYFRKKLNLSPIENLKKIDNPENTAEKFLTKIIELQLDSLPDFMLYSDEYNKNEKKKNNYIKRLSSIKKIKKIEEFSLVSAGYTKDQKQCMALFLLNGKWDFTVVLHNHEESWKVVDFWFGIAALFHERTSILKQIAFLLSKNQLGNAHAALEKYSKIFINYADLHYYWGIYYQSSNHLKEAKEYYFNAIEIDPNYVAALYNYALLLQGENSLEEAKEYYEKILKLNPKEINSMNNLALIHEYFNKEKKAKKLYEKCLKINSDFEQAKKNLDRINKKK